MSPGSTRSRFLDDCGLRPRWPTRGRTGLAAIEFVMALTVILFLLVALLWIGRVAVNSVQATVAARHEAWNRRPQAQPRSFDFTDLEGGRVRGAATVPVSVSPLFDGMILPRAEQTIIGGSWDHRRERLSRSPNRQLYPVLLRNALASGAGGLADVGGLLAAFADNVTGGLENDREAEVFRQDQEKQQREQQQIRQRQAEAEAQAKEKWNQELENTIRKIKAETDLEREKVTIFDRELMELDRAITEHAAATPQDQVHRAEMERLEELRGKRRLERRDVAERIRKLEALEAEGRRQLND